VDPAGFGYEKGTWELKKETRLGKNKLIFYLTAVRLFACGIGDKKEMM
jgi:hypothetical protein